MEEVAQHRTERLEPVQKLLLQSDPVRAYGTSTTIGRAWAATAAVVASPHFPPHMISCPRNNNKVLCFLISWPVKRKLGAFSARSGERENSSSYRCLCAQRNVSIINIRSESRNHFSRLWFRTLYSAGWKYFRTPATVASCGHQPALIFGHSKNELRGWSFENRAFHIHDKQARERGHRSCWDSLSETNSLFIGRSLGALILLSKLEFLCTFSTTWKAWRVVNVWQIDP